MGFFSTAQHSLVPGTATKGLTDFLLNLQVLENRKKQEQQLIQKRQRLQKLGQDLLGFKSLDDKTVSDWAIKNKVTANELQDLKPIFDRRKVKKEVRLVDKEDENFTWQVDPVTNKKLNIREKKQQGQKGAAGKAKVDKVPDWYLKMTNELRPLYINDTMVTTKTQRDNFDRAMSMTEIRVNKIAADLGISNEQAYPLAAAQLRKERILSRRLSESGAIPVAVHGTFSSNDTEAINAVHHLLQTGVPSYTIIEVLKEKGWKEKSIADILKVASTLITPKQAGIDMSKIISPSPGGSILINNKIWFLEGKYLINEDGQRIRIND